ncbi:MoaD/ThiS family protein [Alteriqipengyuania sp.]|uniref:MoaD/ThiS family protein n=1 Tax=Alteriqipengyuania sp. TaxID=2800692 RepID=UPI0035196A62
MSVTVLFLGPLRDLAGAAQADYPAPLDWEGLLAAVPAEVAEQLREPRVHIACAGKVLSDKATLCAKDGDEVALLPPVSGG